MNGLHTHAADETRDAIGLLAREVDGATITAAEPADRIGDIQPSAVARPLSPEGVAAVIAAADRNRLAVTVRGGGTRVEVGNPLLGCDVVLSTAGLDRVLRHDAADMTVSVQSGVTLAALDRALASAAQWLPIDAPLPMATTIGGMIAADLNGGLRFGFGKVRDYLLGVRLVTGTGELIRGGGQVVKNVAGYDLPKLMVGSWGTLGVVVEATFKVRPRPAADVTFAAAAHSLRAAADRAATLLDQPLAPVALDVVNAAAAGLAGLAPRSHVVVRLAGEPAEVDAQRQRLASTLGDLVELDAAALVSMRDFQVADVGLARAKASVLPRDAPLLLEEIEAFAADLAIACWTQAHAGNGVIRLRLASGENDVVRVERLLHWLRFRCRQLGGHVVVEKVPSPLAKTIDVWGVAEPTRRLMARVKAALDPHGTFSPGRL